MKGNHRITGSVLALLLGLSSELAFSRGQIPPPPPFTGGNIGAWLGSGPIFGFEDGGGANGGWGGSYFEPGGWGGWGSGAGGSGGYGGMQGGRREGNGHRWEITGNNGGGMGGLHGTCWADRLPGRRSECACSIRYNPVYPPPSGTVLFGICTISEITADWYTSCSNAGDICSGYMP